MAVLTTLFSVDRTADQRQFNGQVTKPLTMAVLWTLFGVLRFLTCGHVAKTADHGSSMDSFRSPSPNCGPKAVLWTLFGLLKSC